MNRLSKILDEMESSPPIHTFSVSSSRISSGGNRSTTMRYKGDQKNRLVEMANDNFFEKFNETDGKYYVDKEQIKGYVYRRVIEDVLEFLRANMQQKHPKETKLYKFFNQIEAGSISQQMADALCELVVFFNGDSLPKSQIDHNTLKICEYLYAKNS